METVELVGGTRNGELFKVNRFQDVLYVTKRIKVEEALSLQIDDSVTWKFPEEVYRRIDKRKFIYDRTVNYKPE